MSEATTAASAKRLPYLSILVRTFYELQAHRIEAANRIDGVTRDGQLDAAGAKELHEKLDERLLAQERDLHKMVCAELDAWPIWNEFLSKVTGIAETLAGALIAEIRDISQFSTVSKLWAYAGMSAKYVKLVCPEKHKLIAAQAKPLCPVWTDKERTTRCGLPLRVEEEVFAGQRRVAGYRSTWNPRLKLAAWKASMSFLKVGKKFKAEYYTYRQHYDLREGWTPGHCHAAALRATAKIFLAALWHAWRTIELLPAPQPWAIAHGGHPDPIDWRKFVDKHG